MLTSDFYGRKSTKDAGQSAARQERDWHADCASEGLEPGRRFVDPDLSASRFATKQRPDYLALVEHIKSGNCQMISMWEASRGSREIEEWIQFLKLCRSQGVLIRIFGGDDPRTFDVRKRRDWRTLVDEGVDAHDESDKLSERIRDGVRDRAAEGRPASGRCGYGYAREYGPLIGKYRQITQVKHKEQSAIIRRMVADTLAGISLNSQARKMNDAGVPTASGQGKWQGFVIRRILLNPMYLGRRLHNGRVTAENCWPEIITEDEHRRLVAMLTAPGRRNPGTTELKYQLAGAAGCGRCGGRIESTGARPPDRKAGSVGRYRCRDCVRVSARIEHVDELISRLMVERLRKPDALAVFAPARDDSAAQAAKAERDQLADRLADAKREWKAGHISAVSFGEFERELTPDLDAAERRYQKLITPAALEGMDPLDVADRWHDLPVGVRREVIIGLAEIVISPVGSGYGWSPERLGESRWRGDTLTWGEHWRAEGLA